MKSKILFLLVVSCLLALAAWLVHAPNSAQADAVPGKYRETVDKGLEYLAKAQFTDGHWEGDGGNHPVTVTALIGLALLMEKERPTFADLSTPRKVKYSANVRKAVDWLVDKSQPGRDGLIFSEHASETTRYMTGHGLATLFLAGACKEESDESRRKKLTDVLTRAVRYIQKAQSSQGGWYDTSKVEGHDFASISATAIQIQALQAAANAGVSIPFETISDAQEYLKKKLQTNDKAAEAGKKDTRLADVAAVLACTHRLSVFGNSAPKDELREKWLKECATEIAVGNKTNFGRDELAHYYYAQALFGDSWNGYRTAMFDHLQSSQSKDGSWPAGNGIGVGQVYSTAVWCIVLQLDKGNHPSLQSPPVLITTRKLGPLPVSGRAT
jgi:hypothetical protein